MFPLLVWVHVRLAKSGEADGRARFGADWENVEEEVQTFLTRLPETATPRQYSDRVLRNDLHEAASAWLGMTHIFVLNYPQHRNSAIQA